MVWMRTPVIRPPSSAGIGRRLNRPKANEIIPMRIRSLDQSPCSKMVPPMRTMPTGPESCVEAFCLEAVSPDRRVETNLPREANVMRVWCRISSQALSGACRRGNWIFLIPKTFFVSIITPKRHFSPHWKVADCGLVITGGCRVTVHPLVHFAWMVSVRL